MTGHIGAFAENAILGCHPRFLPFIVVFLPFPHGSSASYHDDFAPAFPLDCVTHRATNGSRFQLSPFLHISPKCVRVHQAAGRRMVCPRGEKYCFRSAFSLKSSIFECVKCNCFIFLLICIQNNKILPHFLWGTFLPSHINKSCPFFKTGGMNIKKLKEGWRSGQRHAICHIPQNPLSMSFYTIKWKRFEERRKLWILGNFRKF